MADSMILQRTAAASGPETVDTTRKAVSITPVAERGIVHVAGRLSVFDGLRLPEKPNTCIAQAGTLVAWLGPHRWLLVGTPADAQRWLSLKTAGAAVADLSHGREVVRVTGPGWRDLLSRGCPLDAATAFKLGQWSCAQSLYSEVPVLICVPPDSSFAEFYVPSSYGAFISDMLAMAAAA